MKVGDLISGRFHLEAVAGEGGMGTVYRAVDHASGERVAVKVMRRASEQELARFARETKILSELAHPGIVGYRAHGQTDDGQPYLAVEWLDGEDLSRWLARRESTIEECVAIALQAARALGEAHRRGIVHRDVKPSNIFVLAERDLRIKLLDFGVARVRNVAARTMTGGGLVGTPGYMAPEQARGDKEIDLRADVFSLGCVLFECLAKRAPYEGDQLMAILASIILEDAPRVRLHRADVPDALDDLVARMMCRDREGRPTDVASELEALAKIGKTARRSERPPALTTAEQRVMSVLLACDPSPRDMSDATLAPEDTPKALAAIGGDVVPLGGAWIITFAGSAAEQAERCVDGATEIGKTLGWKTAVVTGRGTTMSRRLPLGEVVERGLALLERAGEKPEIDEGTLALLGDRFDLGRPARTLLGRAIPMVGRDAELAILSALVGDAASEPSARAAVVTGPAGVGKTRLRHELVLRARQSIDPAVWIARATALASGSAHYMIAQALRQALGSDVAGGIARVVSKDAPRITELVCEMLGVPSPFPPSPQLEIARRDPTLLGDQIRSAVIEFVGALAATRPIVFVLEDAQWSDAPSMAICDAMLAELEDRPIVLLAVARPELSETFPALWERRGAKTIRLAPLAPKNSARLVKSALPNAGEDVVKRIVDRAQGNPFFLEELVRAVADGKTELPETILAMAQARLEALDPDARRVLRAASVFGRTFSASNAAALAGNCDAWLDVLVRRELLVATGTELHFTSALVRDAAYESLTEQDRKTGHQLAGDHLASQGADPVVIAEHYDRGNKRALAIPWFRKGAELAIEGQDFQAAISFATRAIDIGASGEMLGALHLLAAEASRWGGSFNAARKHAELAANELARGRLSARAREERIMACTRLGDFESVAELARAEEPPGLDRVDGVRLACVSARALFHAGMYDLAEDIVQRIEPTDVDAFTRAEIFRLRGARARHHGKLAEDRAMYEAAWRAYEEAGHAREAANARASLGFACVELGEWPAAREHLEGALAAAEDASLPTIATRARQNLGLLACKTGRLAEARALLEDVIGECKEQGNARFEAWTRLYLSETFLLQGDAARAEEEAKTACDALAGTPPARAAALASRSRALLAQGRTAEALSCSTEAHRALKELGTIEEFELLVRMAHVDALAARGHAEEATRELDDAKRVVRERYLDTPEGPKILSRVLS